MGKIPCEGVFCCKSRKEGQMHRLKKIGIFIGILFIALTLRLAYIQLLGHEELSAAAGAQALIQLEGSNTRGIIYDRTGAPLVADEKQYIYIIKDSDFTKTAGELLEQIGAELVRGDNKGYQVYTSTRYNKYIGSRLIRNNKAYILQAAARYGEGQVATHFIGYVNKSDHKGAAGLELMFDDRLSGLDRRVYAAADVKGNILPGRGLIITSEAGKDSYVAEGIRVTVDKELQAEVEDIIENMEKDCAVAVLESKTGGVAAMACTPGFDPDNVEEIISSENAAEDTGYEEDVLINKVTQGEYPPGSVFKIVTAAAALENGIGIDRKYYCSGHAELDGMYVKCYTGGDMGHGTIGFEDAMAESCNSYFIQLGCDIGAEKIVEMAENMSLGKTVLKGYPQEAAGHLMDKKERAGNAIGNLSIGQGETLVTPLQIASMTNIIANDGADKGVHILIDEQADQNRILSENTAVMIKQMMTQAAEEGTGAALDLIDKEGKALAGVKTGTAEYETADGMSSHGWITGFTPCDDPEYVITVFVEDGGSGTGSAGPIFKKIVEYLRKSGAYSMPALA